MNSRNVFVNAGTSLSESVGKMIVDANKSNPKFKEAFNFKEDNQMSNSTQLYTTVLAKAIWYKSYDKFEKYYDIVNYYTPEDLGMPEGAGVYKIPKIQGATAIKPAEGEVFDYTNDDKDEVLLTTETYGIATRIGRRLLRRAAKGAVEKFMLAASDAVHRAVCSDIINGMVAGATTSHNVATGISYDAIELAKQYVRDAKTDRDVLYGFEADYLVLSSAGERILATSTDYKNAVNMGQRNVPGEKFENKYTVFAGLNVVKTPLITATKSTKVVHGIVFDKMNFLAFLMETEMETFDGRLQGTAGDIEVIHALDAGLAVLNDTAASVITAS